MRKLILMATMTGLSATMAMAQTPPVIITGMLLNVEKQTLSLFTQTEFPIPTGTKFTVVSLDCTTGKAATRDIDSEGERDADGKSAQLIKTGAIVAASSKISVKHMAYGKSVVFGAACKNKVLQLDFSNLVKNQLQEYSGESFFSIRQVYSYVLMSVPMYQYDRYAFPLKFSLMSTTVGRLGQAKKVEFDEFEPRLQGDREALFQYNPQKNTLTLIRSTADYGSALRAGVVGSDGKIIVYYTTDYKTTKGWRKVTVDLKAGIVSNELAPVPAKAKFVQ